MILGANWLARLSHIGVLAVWAQLSERWRAMEGLHMHTQRLVPTQHASTHQCTGKKKINTFFLSFTLKHHLAKPGTDS